MESNAAPRRTIAAALDEAREQIVRLTPTEAQSAAAGGALIIDIRSELARERDGVIPGSLHVPRTVLEWRVDPDSPWRNPTVGGLESQLILVCDHGYSSSLAAATLVQLGFEGAGDVIGGFEAWAEARLPVVEAPRGSHAGRLPGMGTPD